VADKKVTSGNFLIQFFKQLYLTNRFFYMLTGNVLLFILAFILPGMFLPAQLALLATVIFLIIDIFILFSNRKGLEAERILPEKFSNGDKNPVTVTLRNNYGILIHTILIDELPFQLQNRDFRIDQPVGSGKRVKAEYSVSPTERGEYHFGDLNIYAKTVLGLASKRYVFNSGQMVKTYPGFLKLREFDLFSIKHLSHYHGIKKIRRIGNSFEFEQIKKYVQGDNIKDINWKATAKKNKLMVNQFQDEKAQQVYSIIDKGRVMKMPFEDLTLLDHAVNASLVISNVVLGKQDKAGVFSFSKRTDNFVVAERRNSQMKLILESLYNVSVDFFESDFGNLYASVKRHVTQRSLLFLYTNFEGLDSVRRQMNYLRALNKSHLLVVIFFQNTELEKLTRQTARTTQEIFDKVIAEKFVYEKRLIVSELNNFGIQTILTTPQNLTIDTINKYLEIKSKGLL
jgi:uncharacterized protein (DUF58 family)